MKLFPSANCSHLLQNICLPLGWIFSPHTVWLWEIPSVLWLGKAQETSFEGRCSEPHNYMFMQPGCTQTRTGSIIDPRRFSSPQSAIFPFNNDRFLRKTDVLTVSLFSLLQNLIQFSSALWALQNCSKLNGLSTHGPIIR